jgi:hypothetical protein
MWRFSSPPAIVKNVVCVESGDALKAATVTKLGSFTTDS